MKNLAGLGAEFLPVVDETINSELAEADIERISVRRVDGEVFYEAVGKLGSFIFTRASSYWVAEGNVPSDVAKEMCFSGLVDNLEVYKREDRFIGPLCKSKIKCRKCEQAEIKSNMFVNVYRIYTQEGLNYFVKIMKKNQVV